MNPSPAANLTTAPYISRKLSSLDNAFLSYPMDGRPAVECLLIVYLLTAKVNCQFGGLFYVWASGSLG